MINTGPTNNKIYHRCIRLISMFRELNTARLEMHCKAIYNVDDLANVDGDFSGEAANIRSY